MALLPFDRTCHRLSYRVIGRKLIKLVKKKFELFDIKFSIISTLEIK